MRLSGDSARFVQRGGVDGSLQCSLGDHDDDNDDNDDASDFDDRHDSNGMHRSVYVAMAGRAESAGERMVWRLDAADQ
jgi:hypothetical protein